MTRKTPHAKSDTKAKVETTRERLDAMRRRHAQPVEHAGPLAAHHLATPRIEVVAGVSEGAPTGLLLRLHVENGEPPITTRLYGPARAIAVMREIYNAIGRKFAVPGAFSPWLPPRQPPRRAPRKTPPRPTE